MKIKKPMPLWQIWLVIIIAVLATCTVDSDETEVPAAPANAGRSL
ncbi:hypothetical protein [Caballeronia sp. KNU42]